MGKCHSPHIVLYPLMQAGVTRIMIDVAGFELISAVLCAAGFTIIGHALFHWVGTQLGIE